MIQKILNFIKENYWTIIKVIIAIYAFYWVIYILTPKVRMSEEEKQKLENLNTKINDIYKFQQKLDSNILIYNTEIDSINNHIENIKYQKTIINKYYYEEINRVDSYTNNDIDSFFTKRYKQQGTR